MRIGRFRAFHPQVRLDPDILYVDDRDVTTSAGNAAGIDLLLHLIRRDHGAEGANRVARRNVVAPWRDGRARTGGSPGSGSRSPAGWSRPRTCPSTGSPATPGSARQRRCASTCTRPSASPPAPTGGVAGATVDLSPLPCGRHSRPLQITGAGPGGAGASRMADQDRYGCSAPNSARALWMPCSRT